MVKEQLLMASIELPASDLVTAVVDRLEREFLDRFLEDVVRRAKAELSGDERHSYPPWLTARQAAEMLHISRDHFTRLVEQGKTPPYEVCTGQRRWNRNALLAAPIARGTVQKRRRRR